jgi:shikimate dehydrogenase
MLEKVIRSKSVCFGGAGVQHPLKNKVAGLCDTLSDAAREIGAVNTIVCLQSGHIGGDNTDWLGIMKPLKQADLVASPVS